MTDRNINELKRLVKRWQEIARQHRDAGNLAWAAGIEFAVEETRLFIEQVEARGKGDG